MSTAYLLWGPPGAGKSTLKNVYGENTILKNTDDIVDFVCNPDTQDEYWACRIKPGRIMFEVDGVNIDDAKRAMTLAAAKLPIKCKFIKRI